MFPMISTEACGINKCQSMNQIQFTDDWYETNGKQKENRRQYDDDNKEGDDGTKRLRKYSDKTKDDYEKSNLNY